VIKEFEIDTDKVFTIIQLEKKQILEQCIGLSWININIDRAAGLKSIEDWVSDRIDIFSDIEEAKRKNIDIPKGIMISGIPGSGKSLMAKYTAKLLNLPLISLDMGGLLGGLVGDSEHNMAEALRTAENMAPCVLWIDEIEKAFPETKSGQSDGGVAKRMFGKFLTWMQEKRAACFVFATSNDITILPPELFRSERFDRKFFTFMPKASECASIFVSNIKAQNEAFRNQKSKQKGVKCILFDQNLEDEKFWLDNVINTICIENPCELTNDDDKIPRWKDNHKPTNKLLTGADISAIIKEAKFLIYRKGKTGTNIVYKASDMVDAIKTTLDTFQPYGETNLVNIVKCFLNLHVNQFQPASGECIINFKNYDDERHIYNDGRQTYDHKTYDQVLYNSIVGAINQYANKIVSQN
jgi:SpoVK/Ycf46/Vps4 family AAA+-type ATPase